SRCHLGNRRARAAISRPKGSVALIGASQEMRYTMMRKWLLTLFVLPLVSPAVAQAAFFVIISRAGPSHQDILPTSFQIRSSIGFARREARAISTPSGRCP